MVANFTSERGEIDADNSNIKDTGSTRSEAMAVEDGTILLLILSNLNSRAQVGYAGMGFWALYPSELDSISVAFRNKNLIGYKSQNAQNSFTPPSTTKPRLPTYPILLVTYP